MRGMMKHRMHLQRERVLRCMNSLSTCRMTQVHVAIPNGRMRNAATAPMACLKR